MEKKNSSTQRKLPSRVKMLLDSDDIDLVQIGANMMKEYIPKKKWNNVLEMFSIDPKNSTLYIRKWKWEINGNDIKITKDWLVDLWKMKLRVNTPLLNLTSKLQQ